MITSTYDLCLLIIKKAPFSVISMQTDNTIILDDQAFNDRESEEMIFWYKDKTKLSQETLIVFNDCIVNRDKDDVITITQKT